MFQSIAEGSPGYAKADERHNHRLAQVGTNTPVFGGNWTISGAFLMNQSRDGANPWSSGTRLNHPFSRSTKACTGTQATFNYDNLGCLPEAGPDSPLHFRYDADNMVAGTGRGTDFLGKNAKSRFVGIWHEF